MFLGELGKVKKAFVCQRGGEAWRGVAWRRYSVLCIYTQTTTTPQATAPVVGSLCLCTLSLPVDSTLILYKAGFISFRLLLKVDFTG